VPAVLEAGDRAAALRDQAAWIGLLTRLEPLAINDRIAPTPARALSVVAGGCRAFLPVEGLFDLTQELERLGHERAESAALFLRTEQLLGRPGFADKAPAAVVQREREKLADLGHRLELLDERLATLRTMTTQ